MPEAETSNDVVFQLERIYLKDVSYEAPGVPQAFLTQENPEINIQLALEHLGLSSPPDLYEVILTVTVTATREGKTFFLVEVKQAGIFRIRGVAGEALEKMLRIACAHVLLPFVREAVNDFVAKGGFPQLLISPINFEALYEHQRTAPPPPAPH